MSKPTYIYSLLQYTHSQVLGEVLNVGLLIYFPADAHLAFLYPEKLNRLKLTYPDVPEKTIRAFFRAFEEKISYLNNAQGLLKGLSDTESFEKFLQHEFLSDDASALQFGAIKRGVQFVDNYQLVCNQLHHLYFSVFDHQISHYDRVDESQLLYRYKSLIKNSVHKKYTKEYDRLFFDYTITPKEGKSFKFDVGWKNGSLNLVKPVSFDVARPETIQNKAYKFYGQFLDLQDYALQENIRFDLLIAKPINRDLFKTFDNAIALLNKPQRVALIDQAEIEAYSHKTIQAIGLSED